MGVPVGRSFHFFAGYGIIGACSEAVRMALRIGQNMNKS